MGYYLAINQARATPKHEIKDRDHQSLHLRLEEVEVEEALLSVPPLQFD